jgi:hypothetical protein
MGEVIESAISLELLCTSLLTLYSLMLHLNVQNDKPCTPYFNGALCAKYDKEGNMKIEV